MTGEELAQLLGFGYEQRGVEFKGPGPLKDAHLLARVARAALGMANRRDGGLVIVGVSDSQGTLDPVGLSATDLTTWKYDDVAATLAPYADPSISFDLEVTEHDRKDFVVLSIHEFEDVPVLCRRGYNTNKKTVLREGACYVRSRHKPETSEIPSQAEMRDLLELAAEKRLRAYVAMAQRAGLHIGETSVASDDEAFNRQLGELR